MWLIGQYASGMAQARDVRLSPVLVPVCDLDPRLDGFTILHLSDLHWIALAAYARRLCGPLRG